MLPTDLQPLARFEAVKPVLKPSGRFQSHLCQRTYICMHIYCSAHRTCIYVFPRRLQSQEINHVQEHEVIYAYCTSFNVEV